MKIGVAYKLFLVILTAAGLAVVSSMLIMQWRLDRGFLKFIDTMEKSGVSRLAATLEEQYRAERNWEFIQRDPARWRQLVAASMPEAARPPGEGMPPAPPPGERRPPPGRMSDDMQPPHFDGERPVPVPPHLARHFDQRLFLLAADGKVLIGHAGLSVDQAATPLAFQGKIVGYLGLLPRTGIFEAPQKRFLKEQKLAFALTAAVVVLLAAGLSLVLARRLVRPLGELTEATHHLASGSFSVRVPVTSHDELGQLANDFNSLALTLEKSEQARRQWAADISHELRTPIAILRGEIEAFQDGIRQPTADTLHSLHGGVLRLARLVDDLYQLSLSDVGGLTYRKSGLDLKSLINETVAVYLHEFAAKGIDIDNRCSAAKGPATVFGDPERLRQLFANLFDNSLKYTDAGGHLQIDLERSDDSITVSLQDSAPGVPDAELDKLFERLYRVESSRNRTTGGAGLGLAICRNIVEAHNGRIAALASPLGGVCIRIELPPAGRY